MSAELTPEGAEYFGLEDATEEEIAAVVEEETEAIMSRLADHFEQQASDDGYGDVEATMGQVMTALAWIMASHPLETVVGVGLLLDLLGVEEVAK